MGACHGVCEPSLGTWTVVNKSVLLSILIAHKPLSVNPRTADATTKRVPSKRKAQGVVYKIPWAQCPANYMGETHNASDSTKTTFGNRTYSAALWLNTAERLTAGDWHRSKLLQKNPPRVVAHTNDSGKVEQISIVHFTGCVQHSGCYIVVHNPPVEDT